MTKIAFIFPGQASQYVGMGREISRTPIGEKLFFKADEIAGFPLSSLCFEGPEEELTQTDNTQPAIVTVSAIVFHLLNEKGIKPEMVAGHSLGEYSALVVAGSLSFIDAVRLVRIRGELMRDATRTIAGGMAAIIGLTPQAVEDICREANSVGIVQATNYNSPIQTAISGEKAGLEKAIELATERGAKRALMLPVSAPFHSSLMDPVAEKFRAELEATELKDAEVPVIANVTAEPETNEAEIRGNLIRQINAPVHWTETIQYMIARGIDTFVEVGPGKVLTGLLKKTDRSVTCIPVETLESIDGLIKKLKK
ncbi:MAG: ACP S-malonyltransferase [Candidatus Euphemobacter frigidus]|nr:ACP S-malonyltransferase [Candidatus Euphemobacter frigidus]MDP8275987.1 ACP S-malonyltransferase [Candidatus Euphemobacter frigidus]